MLILSDFLERGFFVCQPKDASQYLERGNWTRRPISSSEKLRQHLGQRESVPVVTALDGNSTALI